MERLPRRRRASGYGRRRGGADGSQRPVLPPGTSAWWGGFRDEITLTAVLVCLIFALIDERNQAPLANMGPLLIGFLIVAIGFAFGQNSGWAINPARDFGPRLLSWFAGYASAWKDEYGSICFWVPIIGPLIGGVLDGCIYDMIGEFLSLVEQDVGEQAAEARGSTARDRAEEGSRSSTRAIPLTLARLRP